MKEELKAKIPEILTSLGYHFVDVKFTGKKQEPIIEILADSDSGITIDECTEISRKLSEYVDTLDYSNFRLNVSSPGIGYPMQFDWQFKKALSRKVIVKYTKENQITKEMGLLKDFDPEKIVIEKEKGERIEIERNQIQIVKEII
jgi:ribosome maturation factor RimP